MMKKQAGKKALISALAAGMLAFWPLAVSAEGNAAGSEAAHLDADTVEYDMGTGIVKADGNVLMTRGDSKLAGQHAEYNTRTDSGTIRERVVAVRGDMRLTCDEAVSEAMEHITAIGNVKATQEDKSYTGDRVEYYPKDRGHIVMPTGGLVTSDKGTFTAAQIEGWTDENHVIGTGNAHLVCPPKNLEAGGDQMDYQEKERGRVVVTGNAWAVQGNNTMKSNTLTIYLADDGQSTVQ
jgi:lipopolysaccharide export system protein LptA